MAFPVGYLEVGDYEFSYRGEQTLGKFFTKQDDPPNSDYKVFKYLSNETLDKKEWAFVPDYILGEEHLLGLVVLSLDWREETEQPKSSLKEVPNFSVTST